MHMHHYGLQMHRSVRACVCVALVHFQGLCVTPDVCAFEGQVIVLYLGFANTSNKVPLPLNLLFPRCVVLCQST